jgi:hypothetical protein
VADPLTRTELLARAGVLKIVDPMIDEAYDLYEAKEDDEAHSSGFGWSTAFHASQFPGDDPMACGRHSLYELMGIPNVDPVDRRGRMFMDSGKNLELELVRRFGNAGWLLSADQTGADEFQTNFKDEHTWLSGSPDLLVIPHGWNRAHVVEVKGKGQRRPPKYRSHIDPLAEMRALREEPTPKHIKQLGAYIGLANREFHKRVPRVTLCKHTWSIASNGLCRIHASDECLITIEMQPVVDGTLIYFALDDPTVSFERFYSLNRKSFEEGRARLHEWRENFLNDVLPARNPKWGWSKEPCKWCPYKKHACKPDDKADVATLSESHAVTMAKEINPNYDYQKQRDKVLGRWGVEDPLKEVQHG